MYVNNNNVTYFNSFGVKHIPKEIKNSAVFLYWIYRFYVKGKSLWKPAILFSPNDYEENDKIILKYFQ